MPLSNPSRPVYCIKPSFAYLSFRHASSLQVFTRTRRCWLDLGMRPMYVLVVEELKRQYNDSESERTKDQNNWTAGRLTSQLRKAEEEAQRTKRIGVAARLEAENNAAGN
eukprot:scaffold1505_cov146-Skeletonema_marinoi.AAC.20